jgi:putative FmdB family regulatory protein
MATMPTYEYVCAKCGHGFEQFQSMKDAPLKTCPQEACGQKRWGKGRVQRQLGTGAGLIFKGSGFYITDSRSEGYKSAAKKDSTAAETKPAAKTEAKSETKAEAKPAPAPAKKK